MDKVGLSFDRKKIAEISKQYGLIFVVLFGSLARGEKREDSDIDIAVLSKVKPDTGLFGDLFSAFSDIFPHEHIDIRFLNHADTLFRFQVVKDGKLLYGDEKAYKVYVLYAAKSYIDDGRKYFPFRDQLLLKKQKMLEEAL